jgi:hypothetical protein
MEDVKIQMTSNKKNIKPIPVTRSNIWCTRCKKEGHYSHDCKEDWHYIQETMGGTEYDDQDHKEVEAVSAIQHRSEYEEKRGRTIPKIPGICWACGGVGHMSNECSTKKGLPEFLMVCPHCRKEGHKASQCPELLLTRPDQPRASPKYATIPLVKKQP